MIEEGADLIDIGAESTRPNAERIEPSVQIERLKLIIREISKFPTSIDTRSSEVARFALDNGALVVNDVSGMDFDFKIIDVVSEYDAGIILQHSSLRTEDRPVYKDVVEEVYLNLLEKAKIAQEKGVKNIILDPGIGFGKTKENCFEILNRIEEFYSLNLPIMVGLSRKSFLGLENSNDNSLKDALTLAISYPLMKSNVDYLRVHNVKLHKQLLNSVI